MSCEFFLEPPNGNACQNGNHYQSPFMFSIDLKEELRKAIEEERYEDAAKLRDGIVPNIVYDIKKRQHNISYD